MTRPFVSNYLAAAIVIVGLSGSVEAAPPLSRFIPTFVIYYGGGARLGPEDAARLAKYDLIDMNRSRFNQINGDTWGAIKALNPKSEIYLYQVGIEVSNFHDDADALYMNNISRYNKARDFPQGILSSDYPYLFLTNANNEPAYNVRYSRPPERIYYLMDFGSSVYQTYWSQAVKADIIDRPWKADGIFADNCNAIRPSATYGTRDAQKIISPPLKYPDKPSWAAAMNSFVQSISWNLHAQNQKVWCNRGASRDPQGQKAWLELDNLQLPPDLLLEEGAFAVGWSKSDTQFYPENAWKRQVDTLGLIKNSGLTFLSHTQLVPVEMEGGRSAGIDNYGQPVTFYQSLWYSLGSFLLGRNEELRNAYFAFVSMHDDYGYKRITWFDEYDKIDLGRALQPYNVFSVNGSNLYWREFEKGYVVVNPTEVAINDITQFGAVRTLTHETLDVPPAQMPVVASISLPARHAMILLRP